MRAILAGLLFLLASTPQALATDLSEVPAPLLERMRADTECRPFAELANGADIEIDRAFGDGKTLFILPCWSAAYNFGWKVFVEIWEGEYAQMSFAEFYPHTGWTASNVLVNYWYDPATAELGSFSKGRGLGDCGSAGTWVWQEYQFILRSFAYDGTCDSDDSDAELEAFPIVYSAEDPPPADPGTTLPPSSIAMLPGNLLALHQQSTDCEAFEDLPNGDSLYVAALGEGRTLYLVPCISGAYRYFYSAWLEHDDAYRQLWFATPTYTTGWQAEPGIWLDHFDPDTARLFASNLGNSMGNCGMTGVWRWNGTDFDMLEYRMQPDCSDFSGEPGRFPLVFAGAVQN